MKELVMIIRPEKLEAMKAIIDEVNCGGMTISTVMGCGSQKGSDKEVEPLILKVREKCATDHVGDGKIFIRNVEDVVRIRTGERGSKAI